MSYERNEEFQMELTDADLEEINGGFLGFGGVFPLGTPKPFQIKRVQEVLKPRDIFPNGMFPPIQELEQLNNMRFH